MTSPLTTSNRLLAALPVNEFERLVPRLEEFELTQGELLYSWGGEIHHVFFPNNGLCGLLSATESGLQTEVAMVGSEGMLGVTTVLGFTTSPHEVIVQVEGIALRMRISVLSQELERHGHLRDLLFSHTFALLVEISQSVSCNRFHTVKQRLSRWLSAAQDRVGSNTFSVSEELLSRIVGSRRQGVSEAISDLQRLGLLYHGRQQIIILDRNGLESNSCECYRTVKFSIMPSKSVLKCPLPDRRHLY